MITFSVNAFTEHPTDVPEPDISKTGQDVYFEVLEFQPVILSVSFVRNADVNIDAETYASTSRTI